MLGSRQVAVIGEGLAGAMAALTAARNGASVALISNGTGATALSGGSMDICGSPMYEYEAPGAAWKKFTNIRENMADTIARKPHHPYAVLTGKCVDEKAEWAVAELEKTFSLLESSLEKGDRKSVV